MRKKIKYFLTTVFFLTLIVTLSEYSLIAEHKEINLNISSDFSIATAIVEQDGQDDYDSLIQARRQSRINKVESFFARYNGGASPLRGLEEVFVDKAEECGGDYRILVGIAGSESGLGRINVLTYNPFGYLDGVQYASFEDAVSTLACKISWQHIAPCRDDLYCFGRRYAGPGDDLNLFISKIKWFAEQVK